MDTLLKGPERTMQFYRGYALELHIENDVEWWRVWWSARAKPDLFRDIKEARETIDRVIGGGYWK